MLRIHNVTKLYGNNRVLDQVNIEIPSGAITAILGPNGAGKTTLLNIIVGLLKPNEGYVELEYKAANNNMNIVLQNGDEYKQHIGYIPDSLYLYDNLTGREFIEFIANIWGVDKVQYCRDLEYLASTFNMESKLDNFIKTYSKGMRQKVSLISTLIHRPKILILDEPFNGLDPESIRVIKQYFYSYTREGNAILFSSHILDVVEKLCDKIIILNKGNVCGDGDLQTILDQSTKNSKELEEVFYELTHMKGGE